MEEKEKSNKSILERFRYSTGRAMAMLQIPLQLALINPKAPNSNSVEKEVFPDPITVIDEVPSVDSIATVSPFLEEEEGLSLEKTSPGGFAYIDYNTDYKQELNARILKSKLTGESQAHNIDSLVAGQSRVFNLSEMAGNGETVTLSREDVKKLNKAGVPLEYTWYAGDVHEAHQDIIVDNLARFIAVDGVKVLKWRTSGSKGPKIYGMPTVDGELRHDTHVPLSRRAVKTDYMNQSNFRDNEATMAYLIENHAIPPAGQRIWDLSNFPQANEDLRDISNFTRQQDSRKLLLNILRFQPEMPKGVDYELSNNQRLAQLALLESRPALQIGPDPHIYSFLGNLKRHRTKDGLGRLSYKTGSYGGIGQFNLKKPIKTAIAGTPFVNRETGEWNNFEVAGDTISNAEDFLNSPMAQIYALYYTQQDYSKIKRAGYHPAGVAAVAHLLGPKVAQYENYDTNTDDNGTPGRAYYKASKGYPYQVIPEKFCLKNDSLLGNGLNPKLIKVSVEGQAKLDETFRRDYEKTINLVDQGRNTKSAEEREVLTSRVDELMKKHNIPYPQVPLEQPHPSKEMPKRIRPVIRNPYAEIPDIAVSEGGVASGGSNPPDDLEITAPLALLQASGPSSHSAEEEEVLPVLISALGELPADAPVGTLPGDTATDIEESPGEIIKDNSPVEIPLLVEAPVLSQETVEEEVGEVEEVEEVGEVGEEEEEVGEVAESVTSPASSQVNNDIPSASEAGEPQGGRKSDAGVPASENKLSITSAAVAVGSLLAIPITVKEIFIGKKDPKTQKREKPKALKILAGAAVLGLTALVAHKAGIFSWAAAEMKRRNDGQQNLDR